MTNFPIKPLGQRVVVKRDENPTKSGSLYLPETARQSSQTKIGTVVEVGHGLMTAKGLIPVQLKKGDRIFFGEYAGVEIAFGPDQVKYTIMEEKEVMGTLEYLDSPAVTTKKDWDEARTIINKAIGGGATEREKVPSTPTLEERTLRLVKSDLKGSDPT